MKFGEGLDDDPKGDGRQRVQASITVTLAWWWPLYVRGVVMFARMTGLSPDPERVQAMFARAARFSHPSPTDAEKGRSSL